MRPRYAVINQYLRDRFEKEWQLPCGYGGEQNIVTLDPQEAIRFLHDVGEDCAENVNEWIVEKISEEGRELYYRI